MSQRRAGSVRCLPPRSFLIAIRGSRLRIGQNVLCAELSAIAEAAVAAGLKLDIKAGHCILIRLAASLKTDFL